LARDPKRKGSHHYEIYANTIERCRQAAVAFSDARDSRVVGNRIGRSAAAFRFDKRCERIEVARNTIAGITKKLAELGDSKAVNMDDNYWGIERVRSVLSRISINRKSALTLERIAPKKLAAPLRPVLVGYPSKERARDTAFRWYAELAHLVGL
jgi:hypothetical protein